MILLGLVLVAGLLGSMAFRSQEDGTGEYARKALFTLIVTGIVVFCLLIVATAKLWFPHLWKHNSTHDRHKRHTRHHPVLKDREFRR